ncbi:MAG: L-lactate permease [Anaerolineaceae bacterium]|nr:L-lactate permease [Anaerolineaceae bacterium]
MNPLPLLFALLPVVVILLLLVLRRTPADIAGLIGWAVTVLVAWLYFETPFSIVLMISLAGILASLPITLMVAASLLQVTLMKETGAIDRIVALVKTVAPKDQVVQIMILNVGFGTLLAAMGATPVSILPPIMLALGYSSFVAIALPSLGYDALCTYALLGIPIVVFSNFVGKPVNEVGSYFARYMPVISTCITLGMVWIVGKWRMVWTGLIPILLAGLTAGAIAIGMNVIGMDTLTGIAAGLGVIIVMFLYLLVMRKPLMDRGVLTESDLAVEKRMTLWTALVPWLFLIIFALLVNAPFLPFFDLTFKTLAMPVTIIPDAPEKIRLFWQAYFWIIVTTLLALPFLKPSKMQINDSFKKWLRRAPRPMIASAAFFAIAYLINHSGKGLDWTLTDLNNNMVYVIANASAEAFGRMYPAIAPFLGLLGGFISGSETSAIAMLTAIHLSTAEKIGAVGLLVAAASGIGGGLASVISPSKLQNAAASIDRIGEEGNILRTTFVISLAITAVCAILTMFWGF